MFKGIAFALAACVIWGLIFIVPQFMEGYSSLEIALGRYYLYGSISGVIFLRRYMQGGCRYSKSVLKKALFFALISTEVYYVCVVLTLRYATPAVCALILGVSPIAIAFYGNWRKKECSYSSLVIPSLLILIGLSLINIPHLTLSESSASYSFGLMCGLIALAAWSWYVVVNSSFLKDHPHVNSGDWASLIGLGGLFWAIVYTAILALGFPELLKTEKFSTLTPQLMRYLCGCAVLGGLCSWLGSLLWNKASFYLPVALAGQLTIFETVFGVIFVYLLAWELPPLLEVIGVIFLFSAVLLGIRTAGHASHEPAYDS